ncbi:MAG: hypothetical protein A3E01_07520 [Gammaproteobacteria bacterium RIFCSPHIGHO2_12_FULL_63_22]|nr:MAG: hypothetical protein A3E01_07520 [Gammaproteobacteria bacterium RIFCSPHIGHO2_12_FULL_63_22]
MQLDGLLGAALDANRRGRLSKFIVSENSPAIALFAPEKRKENREGDWYGEHAGKWLVAAAKSAARSDDATLRKSVLRVADYLVGVQEADGYLGTYASDHRFMRRQPPKPGSWDGAPSVRTWDIWNHAYLLLGLLEVHRQFPNARYLDAARRIGDLCWRTLVDEGIDVTELGNHHGLSATVLLDPALELHFATGERRYLQLAETILDQAEARPQSAFLTAALEGKDASEIATGKAYQLIWNMVGLAKLFRATGLDDYRDAAIAIWQNIREFHLSLGGGPWGGASSRSRETFNPAGVFDPRAYVETCSTLAWIQLNRELLDITGEARFADEIERSAYNDLLGAQAPDGEDWCYYSFGNGRRVHTTYWRCCKSSGAMALEELPALSYRALGSEGISVELYSPGAVEFTHVGAGKVRIEQKTGYPYVGDVELAVQVDAPARFVLQLRIPAWCQGARVSVSGEAAASASAGGHFRLDRTWRSGDIVHLSLPMAPRAHRAIDCNVQESKAPDGNTVRQEVRRFEYLGITRGPLVYSTGLIDGFRLDETLLLPDGQADACLHELATVPGDAAPRIQWQTGQREPIVFEPYFQAGGRKDGAWRLTWLSVAPTLEAGSPP